MNNATAQDLPECEVMCHTITTHLLVDLPVTLSITELQKGDKEKEFF